MRISKRRGIRSGIRSSTRDHEAVHHTTTGRLHVAPTAWANAAPQHVETFNAGSRRSLLTCSSQQCWTAAEAAVLEVGGLTARVEECTTMLG